jgi:Cys-tRNA(Pro)/Cys-tRNA(Cys) deacylase
MTPAIKLAQKQKIKHSVHEYEHDANCDSYGKEAAEKLGLDENRVFKTLVVSVGDNQLAVAVLPVPNMLSMKRMAKALGVKKAVMAEKDEVLRSTGYVLGGVSPLGQKKRLKTIIDASAKNYSTIYVSAGRRGLDLELNPEDLRQLLNGEFAEILQ